MAYIVDLLEFGLLSANKVVIVLISFISLIGFPLKRAIYLYVLAILSFIGIGWMVITGNNPMLIQAPANLDKISSWIINLSLLIIVTTVIIIGFYKFNVAFLKFINDLNQKNIEIAQNEQNYREIFNSSADAIIIQDLEGKILEVNQAMRDTYGYQNEDVSKLKLSELSSNTGKYTDKEAKFKIKEALEKGELKFDWRAKKKSGELFWCQVALKKAHIRGAERIIALVSDIDEKKKSALQLENYRNNLEQLVSERTAEVDKSNIALMSTNEKLVDEQKKLKLTLDELKATQEKLIHSDKMASLGILSAGVAHEINNPLNFIHGGVVGLQAYLEEKNEADEEEVKTLLEAINEGVARASIIVTSLNHFSRQGESSLEKCNIHEIIDNCLVILNNQLKNRIVINKEYKAHEPTIEGSDGKLHQAFLNILANAMQAIYNKGTIEIATSSDSKGVKVKISDTGCGIPKENISRITEPFYTTKSPGKGTGLGLSITYSIIEEHKGTLGYTSEPGQGTTAIVRLPHVNKT